MFKKTLKERIRRLSERSGNQLKMHAFSNEAATQHLEATEYIELAMAPVSVNESCKLAKKIKNHLIAEEQLTIAIRCIHNKHRRCKTNGYVYCQGSVPQGVNIIKNSDIDVLIFIDNEKDITNMKTKTKFRLQKIFDDVRAESKAIKINHTKSSEQSADVVLAIFNSEHSEGCSPKINEIVWIYDEHNDKWIDNTPFKVIKMINDLDERYNGAVRKGIRFIKNIKADYNEDKLRDKLEVSSFDIASFVYRTFIIYAKKQDSDNLSDITIISFLKTNLCKDTKNWKTIDGSRFIEFNNDDKKIIKEAINILLYEESSSDYW